MTPTEQAQFLKRAQSDPSSLEAQILRQAHDQAAEEHRRQIQALTAEMIRLAKEEVTGQVFRDIGKFHEKFGLPPVEGPGHELPLDLLIFRIKFMREELDEYCDAVGIRALNEQFDDKEVVCQFDPAKALDALVDLVYVAVGTAYLHRFDFNEAWRRVQVANMAKIRAERADQSARGSAWDVVKPPGWEAPDLSDLVSGKEAGA